MSNVRLLFLQNFKENCNHIQHTRDYLNLDHKFRYLHLATFFRFDFFGFLAYGNDKCLHAEHLNGF